MIYFDNAASTKTAPEAIEAMQHFLSEDYANPAGASTASAKVRSAVEEAREHVAALIGASPDEIYFTSGGSESNNTAIFGTVGDPGDVAVCSEIEHPSVLRCIERLSKYGRSTYRIPCPGGYADTDAFAAMTGTGKNGVEADLKASDITDKGRGIVSVMLVNNELGTVQPVRELAKIAHSAGYLFHTDAVQAVGHIPVDVKELGVDMLSMSAHKFHGPKGVGALYIRRNLKVASLIYGGGQERGLRSGTLNVPGIVGLGEAARLALSQLEEDLEHVSALRKLMLDELDRYGCEYEINGSGNHADNILNIGFKGVEGSSLLIELDMKEIVCSTGSACEASSKEPSHVLTAAGLDDELIKGSLRLSFSRYNTEDEVLAAAKILAESVEKLRLMRL